MKHILLIDNFDSFVHNLNDELQMQGVKVTTVRADWDIDSALEFIKKEKVDAIVLSPGPGAPKDARLCNALLDKAPKHLPILGVCLGHQCMVEFFGGIVDRAPEMMHGKASQMSHNNEGLFEGLPNPMQIARYHSLIGTKIPDNLIVDAKTNDVVMGLHHKSRPLYGVQFHPESVLTPDGSKLITNFLRMIK